jgi:Amt family ammonium transporter
MPASPALVGAIMIGKRAGYGKDNMAPHSMTLTMVGAAILWVGWFGFNAGSNLEANGGAALAMINTFTATAGAIVAWVVIEGADPRQGLDAGRRVGHVAGLVAITPACGLRRSGRRHRARRHRQRRLLLSSSRW